MNDNAENIGVTLHEMNEAFDSGEILSQSEITMDVTKSLFSNNCQLFEKGSKLAVQWIKNDQSTVQLGLENNLGNESYDSWPTSSDVKNFKQSGKTLICLSGLWNKQ
jgi:methionyl-tRNA formyltransferase